MMFGLAGMTAEMLQRMQERTRELERRVKVFEETGMSRSEAYIRAMCDMEHEEWQAAERVKLDDIRLNGT